MNLIKKSIIITCYLIIPGFLFSQTNDGQDYLTKTGVTLNNTTVYARRSIRILTGCKLKTGTKLIVNNDLYSKPLPAQVLTPNSGVTTGKDKNFIFTQTFRDAVTDTSELKTGSNSDVIENVQYYDGMGRLVQSVDIKGGPQNEDIIVPVVYNNLGLEEYKYLPFAQTGRGQYRENAVDNELTFYSGNITGRASNNKAYSYIEYEHSPMQRVLSQAGPGSEWGDKKVSFAYGCNTSTITRWTVSSTNTLVRATNAYAIATLYTVTSTDENGNSMTEYKDKLGRVILKEGALNTKTYYVYDDFGNLRFVLPPESIAKLDSVYNVPNYVLIIVKNLCYYYQYDGKRRMIVKQLPGAGPVYMVYDNADRLVLTQDSVMRNNSQWMCIAYDICGRPVRTCLIANSNSRSDLQNIYKNRTGSSANYEDRNTNAGTYFQGYTVRTFPATPTTYSVLTVNYYDDYDFDNNGSANTSYSAITGYDNTTIIKPKGMMTSTKTSVFPNCTTFVVSTVFYNKYGRPVQTKLTDHLGISETTTSVLNLLGEVQKQKTTYTGALVGKSNEEKFAYDQRGRIKFIKQILEGGNENTLFNNIYNVLGELVQEYQMPVDNLALQLIDYTYNIRGWLTGINPVITSGENDLFNMKLNYIDVLTELSNDKQYNGNISAMQWHSAADTTNFWNAYGFKYDALNRLTEAGYGAYNIASTTTFLSYYKDNYNEKVQGYDKNGNITKLNRRGIDTVTLGVPHYATIDSLTYNYSLGIYYSNKLQKVSDATTSNVTGRGDFYDVNNAIDYTYDGNGNLTSDLNKGITSIEYNILNLPQKVIFVAGQKFIDYIYTAAGALVQKKVTDGGVVQYTENYLGPYTYKTMGTGTTVSASDFSYLTTSKGRWVKNAGGFYIHEFYLKDHLGNTRVVYSDDNNDGTINPATEVKQYASYYPFGMMHYKGGTLADDNRKLYNGKEFESDLNLDWYDYGARFYDATLGRWMVIDAMLEKHYDYTPYNYCFNNPILFLDPVGLDTVWVFDQAERPEDDASYTATIYVEQDGEINGPYEGSSFPDDDDATTLNEGEYDYNNEYGHSSGDRKGLNIVDENGLRNAPGTDKDGNDKNMTYVNVHDSFDENSRNSEGCPTVPHSDPDGFFDNFDWSGSYNGNTGTTGNSTGTLILLRGENADIPKAQVEGRQNPLQTLEPIPATKVVGTK